MNVNDLKVPIIDSDTTEFLFQDLKVNTEYDIYIRAICPSLDTTNWIYVGRYNTLNDYVRTIPYVCDFQNEDEKQKWSFVNTNQINQWTIGSDEYGVISEERGNALYISNNQGASVAYSAETSVSWAYRTIYLSAGTYSITYDWNLFGYTEGGYPMD